MPAIEFATPAWFIALVLLPALYAVRRWWSGRPATFQYSVAHRMTGVPISIRQRMARVLPFLYYLAVALLVTAMARPRIRDTQSTITAEGIDIILTIDISRSMLIEDMDKMSRLEAAKRVAEKFVMSRQTDRVGLVVFAGESFTQCPLTVDYDILTQFIRQLQTGIVEDGTAIGMGLINSINRLRQSQARSKVIILLTDGQNNRGEIDPITASQLAQTLGIRVYTIGAGKDGIARIPVDDPFFGRQYVTAEVKIDEVSLKQIADNTGGQYFRATNPKALDEIYDQIGRLEKTRVDVKTYLRYQELYLLFVLPAAICLLAGFILSQFGLSRLP
jgi:Ca-activated chloride channel family protein